MLASSIAGTDLRLESARIRLDENVNKNIQQNSKKKMGGNARGGIVNSEINAGGNDVLTEIPVT